MLSGWVLSKSVVGGGCSGPSAPISTATTCPDVGGGGGGCDGGGRPPVLDTKRKCETLQKINGLEHYKLYNIKYQKLPV